VYPIRYITNTHGQLQNRWQDYLAGYPVRGSVLVHQPQLQHVFISEAADKIEWPPETGSRGSVYSDEGQPEPVFRIRIYFMRIQLFKRIRIRIQL
jgi:hypothetical protein